MKPDAEDSNKQALREVHASDMCALFSEPYAQESLQTNKPPVWHMRREWIYKIYMSASQIYHHISNWRNPSTYLHISITFINVTSCVKCQTKPMTPSTITPQYPNFFIII